MYFVLLAIIVVILAISFVLWYQQTKKYLEKHRGPFPVPIAGSFFEFRSHRHRRIEHMEDLVADHGSHVHFHLFGERFLMVNDAASVQHILNDNFNNYCRYANNIALHALFGSGIFLANGDQWKLHRDTARPMFKIGNLDHNMTAVFSEQALHLLRLLSRFCSVRGPNDEELAVEVQDLFQRYTLDSIGLIGFDVNIGSLSEKKVDDNDKKGKAIVLCENDFAKHFDYAQQVVEDSYGNPFLRNFQTPSFRKSIEYLDNYVYDIIKRRRQETVESLSGRNDLLSKYMLLVHENGQEGEKKNQFLNDEFLRDTVLNFFIAGRDTTAILLTWAFYLLSLNLDKKQKLIEEIDLFFEGEDTPKGEGAAHWKQFFGQQRLKKLSYLHNVLKETLRLYPPVPADGRYSVNDDVLPNGLDVPKGTNIFWSAWVLHRNEEAFPNPNAFLPERWEDITEDNTTGRKGPHPYQYIPFHAGPQTCLGQAMAVKEAKIVVALVMRHFDFKLDKTHPVAPRKSIVMPAMNGVKLFFTPRSNITPVF